MSRLLDPDGFRERTLMPEQDVTLLEVKRPGFLQKALDRGAVWIEAQLAKRYAVPFGVAPVAPATVRTDVPEIVLHWLTAIVTEEAYGARGWNPSSEADDASILKPAERARVDIALAADSEKGLFELPLKASSGTGANAVTRAGPHAYTETSPYVHMDVDYVRGREEDANGEGTLT